MSFLLFILLPVKKMYKVIIFREMPCNSRKLFLSLTETISNCRPTNSMEASARFQRDIVSFLLADGRRLIGRQSSANWSTAVGQLTDSRRPTISSRTK
jgi:hypothetical protein